jgi:hypothetical protein
MLQKNLIIKIKQKKFNFIRLPLSIFPHEHLESNSVLLVIQSVSCCTDNLTFLPVCFHIAPSNEATVDHAQQLLFQI